MSRVAIVLLNYNSTRYTRNCIRSLRSSRAKTDEYSIVVWDNDSMEKPTNKDFVDADLVLSKTNDGFARGYNRAVSYTMKKHKPEYLIILNNDTRVPKGMISSLIATCKKHKDMCLAVPKIYFEHGYEFHKNSYIKDERGKVLWYAGGGIDWKNILPFHRGVDEVDRTQFDTEEETPFVTGCCICLTPKVWKRIGGFDEKYFLYFEDIDLSLRAKKKGIKLIYAPSSKLYHINAGSTTGRGSLVQQYYQTRNRLRFGLQYAGVRAKVALLKEAWELWKSGTQGERLGVQHALEGTWGNQTHKLIQKA